VVDDFSTFLPFFAVTITAIGVITVWVWNLRTRKDQQAADIKSLAYDVERIAREKSMQERAIAKELAEEARTKAVEVRQELLEKVGGMFGTLRAEIALMNQKIFSDMEARESKIDQLRKDFEEYRKQDKRDMEILQTLAFGGDAKSTPPYIVGEEQTQAHRDEPGTGMFYEQTQEEQEQQTAENVERQKEEQKKMSENNCPPT